MKGSPPSNSIPTGPWDVVVIGAGAAGLMTCIELPQKFKVLLLNRNTSRRSSSRWAQGGIAAVTQLEDSADSHAQDTHKAGAGLCDHDAVRLLVEEAPRCVSRLQELGMAFDRDGNSLATTLEAAHSHRRVLHVEDQTGRALVEVLQERVEQRSNLLYKRGVRVTQLWVEDNHCKGVQILDGRFLHWIPARAVVLASGGGGHLYANTTNPAQASGEGIALAWNAGAAIKDTEFVQFHPTALKLSGAPCFLITEAMRGEGAYLIDKHGNSPVSKLERKDLSPRDQVSRALLETMQNQKANEMYLSLRNIPKSRIKIRFPTILKRCKEFGLDPLNNPIPVAPAAHYWMGGVATNLQGETSLPGLYAVGEAACTGLHGANRLASNSLMECLVFAKQMASIELINLGKNSYPNAMRFETCNQQLDNYLDKKLLYNSIEDLRQLCWIEAGVNRTPKGMRNAINQIKSAIDFTTDQTLLKMVEEQGKDIFTTLEDTSREQLNLLLDLSNRQLTSLLLLEACLFRKESRGGHYRSDYPSSLPYWQCHSIQQKGNYISTKPIRD